MEDALDGADAVMVLRIQHERMHASFIPSEREYFEEFALTERRLARTNGAIVLHPGPLNRGVEISSEVADGSASVILEQVRKRRRGSDGGPRRDRPGTIPEENPWLRRPSGSAAPGSWIRWRAGTR